MNARSGARKAAPVGGRGLYSGPANLPRTSHGTPPTNLPPKMAYLPRKS